MKFSAAILVLSFGAVSAFGLQPNTSAAASIRANAPFTTGRNNKAMVQPIGLDGKRMDTEFVSASYCENILINRIVFSISVECQTFFEWIESIVLTL
jgi:hypothetical protein